jgi:Flp pilus assembly protein TadD
VTLGALGTIDARQGDLPRAEQRLRRALRIKEGTLGADHPHLVPTLGSLGVVCRRRGRHAEAKTLTETALGVLEFRGITSHPHDGILASNLATIEATRPPRKE